jgi:branched-subunit amino acid transport protein
MSAADVWLAIAGITLSTVLTRAAFLVTDADLRLPRTVELALRYAPVCALNESWRGSRTSASSPHAQRRESVS